jgi:O-antigen ligase
MNTSKYLYYLLYFFYIIFFISIICSFRAISSIVIALILLTSLVKNKIDTGVFFNKNIKNSFLIGCCIVYLLQVASLLYTHNFSETITHLRIKSALVFIPFAICCTNYITPLMRQKLMKYYVWILFAAMLYCFAAALKKYYFLHAENEVFFYHQLVSPFKQHAVQVSFLIFAGLIYLLEITGKNSYFENKFIHFLLIIYFLFCIVMLSSKLVIIFSSVCCLYYLITLLKNKNKSIASALIIIGIAIITLVMVTINPVSKRFNEIISGNISMIEQQKFSPAIYFNGLQFRLLEWRFVSQILTENNAWLIGVSPADAQHLLDQKYISTKMYIGEPGASDHGFLGYDTHNQFLESVLQTGILGLLIFIFICYSLIRLAFQRKSIELSFIMALLIAYAFTESCFESQYGLVLFTFFPLFIYYGKKNNTCLSLEEEFE